jgi:hypothetical protein
MLDDDFLGLLHHDYGHHSCLFDSISQCRRDAAKAAQCAANTAAAQLRLTRDQLIRTQSAIVAVILELEIHPNGDKQAKLTITLLNDGHETAQGVHGEFDVVPIPVGNVRITDKPFHISTHAPYELIPVQDLEPMNRRGRGTENTYSQDYVVPFSDRTFEQAKNAVIAVQVSGSISYNNGFDDVSVPVCWRYIHFATKSQRVAPPWDFTDCKNFQSALESAVHLKEAEMQK